MAASHWQVEDGSGNLALEDGTGAVVLEPLVQSAKKVETGVNNTTVAFPFDVIAGNLIVVTHVHWTSIGAAITTPTDTLGHNYVPLAAEQQGGGGNTRLRSFYVENTSGGANTTTFDIAGTATDGEMAVVISEWRDFQTSSPLDVTSSGTDTGTAASSGDVTPSADNCLLYAAMSGDSNGSGATEEAGWTLLQKDFPAGSIPVATEWKVQSTAAAENADWTLDSSQLWIAHVGAFKPAAGAPAWLPRPNAIYALLMR